MSRDRHNAQGARVSPILGRHVPFWLLELLGASLLTLAGLVRLFALGESQLALNLAVEIATVAGIATLAFAVSLDPLLRRLLAGRPRWRGTSDADLPEALNSSLTQLSSLPPKALEQVAKDGFPEQAAKDLEALNLKQQQDGLTPLEEQTRDKLLEGYERVMLLRAEAAKLLVSRGHDASALLGNG